MTVVAGSRGSEEAAAHAVDALRPADPSRMSGILVGVPVLRPGGRFASGSRGANGQERPSWRFPGDAGGDRRERSAFGLYAELVVGAGAIVVLAEAARGRAAVLAARGLLSDPRVRRLVSASGAEVSLVGAGEPGALLGAASSAGIPALELRAGGSGAGEALERAARAVLASAGVDLGSRAARPSSRTPVGLRDTAVVRAPAHGFVSAAAPAGRLIDRGEILAVVTPPAAGAAMPVRAPVAGVVLEATTRRATRNGAVLFVVGRLRPGQPAGSLARAGVPRPPRDAPPRRAPADGRPNAIGWAERVALPDLGVRSLRAKIDTGARTSALHVARMRVVAESGGPQRRPIIEFALPGARGPSARSAVREFVEVRDSSGRRSRRPVIETTLDVGGRRRRVRVTLTDRGDMLFPMLIGRTALGDGFLVDPSRRYRLRRI